MVRASVWADLLRTFTRLAGSQAFTPGKVIQFLHRCTDELRYGKARAGPTQDGRPGMTRSTEVERVDTDDSGTKVTIEIANGLYITVRMI